jgi:nucleoside-diphosphate-sugar epimerase
MILITGASGFLGSAVVRLAREHGLAIRAMVRPSSRLDLLPNLNPEEIIRADMADPASLAQAVKGITAIVHCAATTSQGAPDLELSRRINVAGTQALIDACKAETSKRRQDAWTTIRFINISSQSAHPANPSVYGKTKLEQDERVMASALDWTILRPSIIYGPQSKGIFDKMLQYCRKLPIIPIIGPGREEMRPIHVDDVAWAALACLDEPKTIGQIYDLGGADVVSFNDFIGQILEALGRKAIRFHLPISIALTIARVLSAVMKNPPLTPDNVTGIQTARHVDISAAQRDFNFNPRSFKQGLEEILGIR